MFSSVPIISTSEIYCSMTVIVVLHLANHGNTRVLDEYCASGSRDRRDPFASKTRTSFSDPVS